MTKRQRHILIALIVFVVLILLPFLFDLGPSVHSATIAQSLELPVYGLVTEALPGDPLALKCRRVPPIILAPRWFSR
jgi:hypothetical protein